MPRLILVNSVSDSERVTRNLLLLDPPVIGVKCLGTNLERKGNIALIIVSTSDDKVYAFDVHLKKDLVLQGGLARVLQSMEVLKVLHNCIIDNTALQNEFGITIRNYFDTQAMHAVLMEKRGLPPRRITLKDLCQKYMIAMDCPSNQIENEMKKDPRFWCRRPVNKELMTSAASYVTPLYPSLHTWLKTALSEDGHNHMSEQKKMQVTISKNTSKRCQQKERPHTPPHKLERPRSLTTEQKHYLKYTIPLLQRQ